MVDTCLAFGNFDGVHAGHLAVIKKLLEISRENGLPSVLLKIIYPPETKKGCKARLTSDEETEQILINEGIDNVVTYKLTCAEAYLDQNDFINNSLVNKFNAKIIVIGEDNCNLDLNNWNNRTQRNGSEMYAPKQRQHASHIPNPGQHTSISEWAPEHSLAPELKIIKVGAVKENGEAVSADMIRDALLNRNIELAKKLLTRPYTLHGTVVHGKGLGRRSNMPTANIEIQPDKFIPAHGVYATITRIINGGSNNESKNGGGDCGDCGDSSDNGSNNDSSSVIGGSGSSSGSGASYIGVTHIGPKPTVDNSSEVTIETYLPDFSGDIYGKFIETELHAYIREIRKFANLEEVKSQVDIDVATAQKTI